MTGDHNSGRPRYPFPREVGVASLLRVPPSDFDRIRDAAYKFADRHGWRFRVERRGWRQLMVVRRIA